MIKDTWYWFTCFSPSFKKVKLGMYWPLQCKKVEQVAANSRIRFPFEYLLSSLCETW